MSTEGRRILWNGKTLLFLLVLALVAVYQLVYTARSEYPRLQTFVSEYRQAVQETRKQETEQKSYVSKKIQILEAQYETTEDVSSIWQKQEAWHAVFQQLTYLEEYQTYIQKIQQDAQRILKGGVFGSADGYSAANAKKTADDFQGLDDISVALEPTFGTERLWKQDWTGCLSVVFVLYLVMQIRDANRRGLWDLLYAASGGRVRLTLRRITILLEGAVLAAGSLYAVRVVTMYVLFGGWDTVQVTVQSMELFQKCTLRLRVWQLMLLTAVAYVLTVFATALVIWAACTVIAGDKLALTMFAVVCAAEYLLYKNISSSSHLLLLKSLNIWNLWNCANWFQIYQNFQIGTAVIGQYTLMVGFCFLLLIGALVVILKIETKRYPKNAPRFSEHIVSWIRKHVVAMTMRLPIQCVEYRKMLLYEKGWIALAIWLCLAAGTFTGTVSLLYGSQDLIANRVYQTIEGMPLEQAAEYLEQLISENEIGVAVLEKASQDLEQKLISQDDYRKVENQYPYVYKRQTVYEKIKKELQRELEQTPTDTSNLRVVSPFGWSRLSGPLDLSGKNLYEREVWKEKLQWNLYQLLIIVFFTAGVFPFEKASRMEKILFAAPGGRRKLWRQKKCAAALTVFLMMAIAEYLQWMQVTHSGGYLKGAEQPAVLLPWFANLPLWVTIGLAVGGIFVIRLATALALTGIALWISAKSKRQVQALCIGIIILIVPSWLQYLTGSSWLPLAAMDAVQILYQEEKAGIICLAGYMILGGLAWMTAKP